MGLSERITQPNTLRMFCMRYFLQLQVVYQPVRLKASPPLKDLLPMPCKNTRNFHPKRYPPLACNTNYYMGTFSPLLSICRILSLPPHWTSRTLLNSKMSLTVFIDFIFFNRLCFIIAPAGFRPEGEIPRRHSSNSRVS